MSNCRISKSSKAPVFKRMVSAVLCCAMIGAVAVAQDPKDTLYTATHEQLAVVKIVLAQESAWNRGDLDGFLSAFEDALKDSKNQLARLHAVWGLGMAASGSSTKFVPPSSTLPCVMRPCRGKSRMMLRLVALLPDPDSPTMPSISPLSTSKET